MDYNAHLKYLQAVLQKLDFVAVLNENIIIKYF